MQPIEAPRGTWFYKWRVFNSLLSRRWFCNVGIVLEVFLCLSVVFNVSSQNYHSNHISVNEGPRAVDMAYEPGFIYLGEISMSSNTHVLHTGAILLTQLSMLKF